MHIHIIYAINTDMYTYIYMFTVHTYIMLYAHIQYIHSITYLDRSKNIYSINKLNICTYVYIYVDLYTYTTECKSYRHVYTNHLINVFKHLVL